MKSVLVLFLIGLLSFKSDISQKVVGKWVFDTVIMEDEGIEEIDSSMLNMLNEMMGSMALIYLEGGKYWGEAMGMEEIGTWTIKEQLIITSSDKGNITKVTVLDIHEDFMVLDIDETKVKFKRLELTEADKQKANQEPLKIETVSVNKEQLIGKWKFKDRIDADGKSASDNVKEMLKVTFIDFAADQTYKQFALIMEDEGKWSLENDGTQIYMTSNDSDVATTIWNIVSFLDNELSLRRGNKPRVFIYSK